MRHLSRSARPSKARTMIESRERIRLTVTPKQSDGPGRLDKRALYYLDKRLINVLEGCKGTVE